MVRGECRYSDPMHLERSGRLLIRNEGLQQIFVPQRLLQPNVTEDMSGFLPSELNSPSLKHALLLMTKCLAENWN